MDTRDTQAALSEDYAVLADEARAEARRLHARWAEAGDSRASLAARLELLLEKASDAARRGELPPRDGGFPLTRFAGEVEWGPEGASLLDRLYELQRLWQRE
jgi:hypothetical protein